MNSARLGMRTPDAWLVALLAFVFGLVGCSSAPVENKIDYKSASNVTTLELPPPVSDTRSDDRAQPRTASGLAEVTATPRTRDVLPDNAEARLQRSGSQRWLIVKASPDLAWDVANKFWTANGYAVAVKEPALGIMETDWLETRASVPSDFVRRSIGNYADFFLNPYKRDKFRTRIEQGNELGTVEMYVSHQGAEQVPNKAAERAPSAGGRMDLVWTPVRANAEVEAEMLSRLALAFSTKPAVEQAAAKADQPPPQPRTRLTRNADGAENLVVDDLFDRAWRRIGLALDRSGFTVVDRDRSKGLYYVRYADPESSSKKEGSFWSKLAFWKGDDKPKPEQYRILITDSGQSSVVSVQNPSGVPDTSTNGQKILALLKDELK